MTTTLKRNFSGKEKVKVRSSVFVCLHRKLGNKDEINKLPKQERDTMKHLHATHVYTLPAQDVEIRGKGKVKAPYSWEEWYRIPIAGRSLEHIKRILRSSSIFDGPYHGAGREMRPVGQGRIPAHAKPAAIRRRKFREMQSSGIHDNWELMRILYGKSFMLSANVPIESALNELSMELNGEMLPSNWYINGEFWLAELKGWEKLEKVQEREIQNQLDIIVRQLAYEKQEIAHVYDLWFNRQQLLAAYLVKRESEKAKQKILKDNARPVSKDVFVGAPVGAGILYDRGPQIAEMNRKYEYPWSPTLTETPIGYNRILPFQTFAGDTGHEKKIIKLVRPHGKRKYIEVCEYVPYTDNGLGI